MKKYIKYIIIIFLISVGVGFILSKTKVDNEVDAQNISGDTSEVGSSEETIVQANIDEEKITPNTNIIIETKYQDCKHTETEENGTIAEELINMTEEDIEENFPDWIIKSFSSDEVNIYRVEEGLCNNHFKITLNEDDMVCVYRLESDYDTELYEETEISAEYLTEEDLESLEEGIYIYGETEVNSTLESFE